MRVEFGRAEWGDDCTVITAVVVRDDLTRSCVYYRSKIPLYRPGMPEVEHYTWFPLKAGLTRVVSEVNAINDAWPAYLASLIVG